MTTICCKLASLVACGLPVHIEGGAALPAGCSCGFTHSSSLAQHAAAHGLSMAGMTAAGSATVEAAQKAVAAAMGGGWVPTGSSSIDQQCHPVCQAATPGLSPVSCNSSLTASTCSSSASSPARHTHGFRGAAGQVQQASRGLGLQAHPIDLDVMDRHASNSRAGSSSRSGTGGVGSEERRRWSWRHRQQQPAPGGVQQQSRWKPRWGAALPDSAPVQPGLSPSYKATRTWWQPGSLRMCSAAAAIATSDQQGTVKAAVLLAQNSRFLTFTRGWSAVRTAVATAVVATAAWWTTMSDGYETASLMIQSAPRTLRTAMWAIRAGLSYKRFTTLHMLEDPDSEAYQAELSDLHTHWAKQLLKVCRANGGVYIKAGQFASAFGAVPREYRTQLAGLEDKASPRPFPQIRKVLEDEVGPAAMTLFSHFEEQATAAASLAQVHRARLVTGQEVAVKLQYPRLASRVAADLAVMHAANALASLLFPGSWSLGWLVAELEAKLELELDFRTELGHARRLAELLKGNSHAAVPRMHEALCSRRVLVMEWISGAKINDSKELKARGINPRAVGKTFVRLFAELTFVHGYMHGDPHPGNAMVREKGRRSLLRRLLSGSASDYEIVFLDHGTYLELPDDMRQQFCQLWSSFVLQEREVQTDVSTSLAGERGPVVLPILLTQSARNRTEERALQRAAGISGFGDMAALMQSAPRDLVELLRINTVIRAVSSQLGVTMEERRRICSWYAARGLPPRWQRGPHIHARFNQALCRAKLYMMLVAWRCWSGAKFAASQGWNAVLGLLSPVLFDP